MTRPSDGSASPIDVERHETSSEARTAGLLLIIIGLLNLVVGIVAFAVAGNVRQAGIDPAILRITGGIGVGIGALALIAGYLARRQDVKGAILGAIIAVIGLVLGVVNVVLGLGQGAPITALGGAVVGIALNVTILRNLRAAWDSFS